MNHYVTGVIIKELREKNKITQKELAEQLMISDKAISKWETGRGLPDLTMIEPLAQALHVSVAELLSGACICNENRSANLRKSIFYVCPVCGNVIWSAGEGAFSCCGITLPPLEAEEAKQESGHEINVERVENEWFVSMEHAMTKRHHIMFLACVTSGRIQIIRLYPEQNVEARFQICGHGSIYAYCNRDGLYKTDI